MAFWKRWLAACRCFCQTFRSTWRCGHSYKLGNAKQLSALMDQMMDENLFEMGERSYTAVMENFTAEGMSKRYQNLYLKLMNKGGR